MYIPRNWEFGSALSKLRNFGGWGGLNPLTPRYATALQSVACQAAVRQLCDTAHIEITSLFVQQAGVLKVAEKRKVRAVLVKAIKVHGWRSGVTPFILRPGTIVSFTSRPP
jgi:hypothetical protein